MEQRTIVLLGKTGVGKSATGNTILRKNAFKSCKSFNSVTEVCKAEQTEINGKNIRVVDTPGFFDTKIQQEKLAHELARSVYLAKEGVHAFVLVFPYGRITEQEEEIIKRIKKVFGEEVTKHMILLFTGGDEEGQDEVDLNAHSNEYIKRVLGECGGRYQIFNNENPNNTQQVTELLEKTESMVRQNRGRCYTSVAYEEAHCSTWEKYWEIFESIFTLMVSILTDPQETHTTFFNLLLRFLFVVFRVFLFVDFDSKQGELAIRIKLYKLEKLQ